MSDATTMELPRIESLERRSTSFWVVTGLAMVTILGYVDYITGYELSFSLFYLIPVCLVAWYAGRQLGIVISVLSAIAWLTADVASGHAIHPALHVWNMSIRLGFFVIVTLLLTALHDAHEAEQRYARIDFLTGLLNARYFRDMVETELVRARRYKTAISLAYVDLDDFKAVNDRSGHAVGDELLAVVGRQLVASLRRTDVVARLGGDEFAILLPQSEPESARVAVHKVHEALGAEMQARHWPVTFSIGVVSWLEAPATVDEMITAADHAMYAVKAAGKGSIRLESPTPAR